jgi:hypothetical protein
MVQNTIVLKKAYTAVLSALRALSDRNPLCTLLAPSFLDLYAKHYLHIYLHKIVLSFEIFM